MGEYSDRLKVTTIANPIRNYAAEEIIEALRRREANDDGFPQSAIELIETAGGIKKTE